MKLLIFSILFILSAPAFAQIETVEENFNESKAILKEIQKENNFKQGSFDIRTGLIQVSANKSEDPLKLNSRNEMPFVEFAFENRIYKRWMLAASFLHAQNALASGTLNDTAASQQMYQVGAAYKMILDETVIKNYVTFKFQYYGMNNNFNLVDLQNFYLKYESGF